MSLDKLPLSEWIRSATPGSLSQSVLDRWAAAAEALETGKPASKPKNAARAAAAKQFWENRKNGTITPKVAPLKLTVDQRAVLDQALTKIRKEVNDPAMPDGRGVEFLAADWMSGN